MGKNRDRGGGHQNSRNDNNNNKRNNGNNHESNNRNHDGNKSSNIIGNKFCNICKKKGHIANDCRFKIHQTSPSSKIAKNNKSNSNGIKHGGKKICERCGRIGHDTKSCTARCVPPEHNCACGNEFHYSNQCPWKADPEVRDLFQNKAGGKICQWCKDEGDGIHEYADCDQVKKFRYELMAKIKSAYDGLKWCWHCQADNHKTRACDRQVAHSAKTAWKAKISNYIDEWVYTDLSTLRTQWSDNEDVVMGVPGPALKAPIASTFIWCFLCQNFGHHPDEATCDMEEYNLRVPARFKSNDALAAKHFMPAHIQNDESRVPSFFLNGAQQNNSGTKRTATRNGTIKVPCRNGCKTWFNMQREPGKEGARSFCRVCEQWTENPAAINRKDSKAELFKEFRKLLEAAMGVTTDKKRRKEKTEYIDQYKFRPSVALPLELAVDRWPDVQPRYDDLGVVPEGEEKPLFDKEKEGDVFNACGNAQSYFPPVLIRLTSSDKAIAADDTNPINRAGRLGLELTCVACGTYGVVKDAEGDLVMCGVDSACTAGCGYGEAEWTGVEDSLRCRCYSITGRSNLPMWIYPL